MEMETEMEMEKEKGRQNYKLQSSRGEVSLSVVVCNCYLARTVIVGPVLSCKMNEEGDLHQHR